MSPFPASTAFWRDQGKDVGEEVILFNLSKTFQEGMSPSALYEATRGVWRVGKRREGIRLALAVASGQVREVYRIHRWHPACTLSYETRDLREYAGSGRWEFEGEPEANSTIRELVGLQVVWFDQNPVRYRPLREFLSQPA